MTGPGPGGRVFVALGPVPRTVRERPAGSVDAQEPVETGAINEWSTANRGTDVSPKVATAEGNESDFPTPALDARSADLLSAFSPFDGASLERTIDRLLGRVDGLDRGMSTLEESSGIIPRLVAAAVGITVAEITRRRLQTPARGRDDRDPTVTGLRGLPLGWGLED